MVYTAERTSTLRIQSENEAFFEPCRNTKTSPSTPPQANQDKINDGFKLLPLTNSLNFIFGQIHGDAESRRALGAEVSTLTTMVKNLHLINPSKPKSPNETEPAAGDATSKIIEFTQKYKVLTSGPKTKATAPNNSPNRASSITDFQLQGRLQAPKSVIKLKAKRPELRNMYTNPKPKLIYNLPPEWMPPNRSESFKIPKCPASVRHILNDAKQRFNRAKPRICVPVSIINLELITDPN